jgi:predicted enzyme related to lactoylglutathione lyase
MTHSRLTSLGLFAAGLVTGLLLADTFPRAAAAKPPEHEAPVGAVRGHVTGIGGVFFKAKDAAALKDWYAHQLGLAPEAFGVIFPWHPIDEPARRASTTWAVFRQESTYFDPTAASFMIDYRVDDLDAIRASLQKAGVKVDEKVDAEPNGRFSWAIDPEGNRFELWEPAAGM